MLDKSNDIAINLKELELNALLEVTQAINNNLPEESLYKIYHFTLLANLNIKKLALFVLGEKWECKVSFGINGDLSKIELPSRFENLDNEAQLEDEDEPFDQFEYIIPIRHKDRLLANVFVGQVTQTVSFTGKSTYTFLEALTNIILVAIENKKLARQQLAQEAYRKELEIAKQVQQFLFPSDLPKNEHVSIDSVYLPHHDVGGDYYDYIPISENKFLFCIADVSGKGVPAALMMSNFQASLRTLVRQTEDLKKIVGELNYQIYLSGNAEIFITFFVGIYDLNQKSLHYINCGHNLPLLLNGSSKIERLDVGTTVLGMFHPLPFIESANLESLSDFYLLCYTDGLSEAENEDCEEFGVERIEEVISESPVESTEKINFKIIETVNNYRRDMDLRDDVTLLSLLVKPESNV